MKNTQLKIISILSKVIAKPQQDWAKVHHPSHSLGHCPTHCMLHCSCALGDANPCDNMAHWAVDRQNAHSISTECCKVATKHILIRAFTCASLAVHLSQQERQEKAEKGKTRQEEEWGGYGDNGSLEAGGMLFLNKLDS